MLLRQLGFGIRRNCHDSIKLGGDFSIDLIGRHQASQHVSVGLPQQVGQAELLEETIEKWIQEIVTRLYIGGPGRRTRQGLQRNGDLLNMKATGVLKATGVNS